MSLPAPCQSSCPQQATLRARMLSWGGAWFAWESRFQLLEVPRPLALMQRGALVLLALLPWVCPPWQALCIPALLHGSQRGPVPSRSSCKAP